MMLVQISEYVLGHVLNLQSEEVKDFCSFRYISVLKEFDHLYIVVLNSTCMCKPYTFLMERHKNFLALIFVQVG